MNLGKQLQNLMDRENISQKQLAQELHLHKSTLNGYIRNHRQPSLETVVVLAAFFHTTSDYLLGISAKQKTMETYTKEEEYLILEYRKIAPAWKPLFLRILRQFSESGKKNMHPLE